MRQLPLALLVVAVTAAAGGQPAPAPPLPVQDIVFVIDQSRSMLTSDPLQLRGAAAGLILDAVELSSDVHAGVVFFSDRADSDRQLHSPSTVRQRLRPALMPPADGGTNMEDGLTTAIAMLSGSSAAIKRIVLITDGMPGAGQAPRIVQGIAPDAARANIQIFALGLTAQVDQTFLDSVTGPTGGQTLVAAHHQQLLELAKRLVGNRDNVYNLKNDSLPSAQMEYSFEVGSGVDRARVTAILDQPQEFEPGEITLKLDGPSSGDGGYEYQIRPQQGDRVAAWTTFFSTPGQYTLRVTVNKPGATGHLGMRIVVEALSDLRASLRLTPADTGYVFGDEVRVDVEAATRSGVATNLQITGVVQTAAGGTQALVFNGTQAVFTVPSVQGRHSVIVRAETDLARTECRIEYEAFSRPPAQLRSSREKLAFVKPIGATDSEVEEHFKLFPEFPDGKPQEIKVSFTVTKPVGIVELARVNGGILQTGVVEHPLPQQGLELALRVRLDPKRPVPPKSGKYSGEIRVSSGQAEGITIPYEIEYRQPLFEVRAKREAVTLWWDPARERTVRLGYLHTDLSTKSTISVILPEALQAPNQGPKVADLALRIAGEAAEAARIEAGKLHYGPLEIEPGKDFPIDLVIKPSTVTGWERRPSSSQPFEIRVLSDLGMETTIKPQFWNLGGIFYPIPLAGTLSLHGRHIATVLLFLVGIGTLGMIALRRVRMIVKFWRFFEDKTLLLHNGAIQITGTDGGGAALVLPNSGSPLDETTLGYVHEEGTKQRVEDVSGHLLPSEGLLASGQEIRIVDPNDEDNPIWAFEYIDYDRGNGGDIEVTTSAAPWTVKRLLVRLCIELVILCSLLLLLGTAAASELAYGLTPVESAYLWFLES